MLDKKAAIGFTYGDSTLESVSKDTTKTADESESDLSDIEEFEEIGSIFVLY